MDQRLLENSNCVIINRTISILHLIKVRVKGVAFILPSLLSATAHRTRITLRIYWMRLVGVQFDDFYRLAFSARRQTLDVRLGRAPKSVFHLPSCIFPNFR